MPIIPAFRRQRQEDFESKTRLGWLYWETLSNTRKRKDGKLRCNTGL